MKFFTENITKTFGVEMTKTLFVIFPPRTIQFLRGTRCRIFLEIINIDPPPLKVDRLLAKVCCLFCSFLKASTVGFKPFGSR